MRTILFVVAFFVGAVVAQAQPPAESSRSQNLKNGRIGRASEKGKTVLRFVDKDGKRIKDIDIEPKETNIRISKNKVFDPADFAVKISTRGVEHLKKMRETGRDVVFTRREGKEISISRNGRFVAVEESVSDFSDYADANDSERGEGPDEYAAVSKIYNLDGDVILELSMAEGWQPVVSNTGKFFVVTVGEYGKQRIINSSRVILAEIPYHIGGKFFSENDRYILLANKIHGTDLCELTVFNTSDNKLELKKSVLPWSTFQGIEKLEISEKDRIMIIHHTWDPAVKEAKVDTVRF